jgi:hypothetical protein
MRSVALGVVAFAACGDDGASHVRADSVVAVDSTAEGCWTCDDDSALEPNDSIQVAHVISTYVMDGLSICPVGDKDYYAITIPIGGSHLEMLVLYEAAGAEVHGALLNSGGLPLANAATTSTRTKRAFLPSLPSGMYYAEIAAPSGINNYRLWLTVTPP